MAAPNTLFAIIDVSNPSAIKAILPRLAPWEYRELRDGQWLLIAPNTTTTQEVSEKLGFDKAGPDTGIVLRVENYFGRNYQALWEWIATKKGASLGTSAPIEG